MCRLGMIDKKRLTLKNVTNAQENLNRTTSVLKSVLCYVLDKVQYSNLVSLF